jgi:hypothetical protein
MDGMGLRELVRSGDKCMCSLRVKF